MTLLKCAKCLAKVEHAKHKNNKIDQNKLKTLYLKLKEFETKTTLVETYLNKFR